MKDRAAYRRLGKRALPLAVLLAGVIGVWGEEGSAEDQKIAAIKQSLTESMAALRTYEWIETVTVKVDGEQKSRKENRCYYGADGKQQKVPIDDGSEEKGKKPRGIRGRIAKRKTEEMEEYIQKALGLVKQYIPPDPERLQAIKNQGAQKLEVLDNASRLRAEFPGYAKKGDVLSVDIDPNANRIVGVAVSSFLEDDPEDAVTLDVTFGTFQDGTSYPSKVELNGRKKELDIVIENTGYRKTGS
jgi:hypothetical protein